MTGSRDWLLTARVRFDRLDVVHAAAIPLRADPTAIRCGEICTIAAISLTTSGRLASSKAKFSKVAVICPNPARLLASLPAHRHFSS
jgi:hypothetical protein